MSKGILLTGRLNTICQTIPSFSFFIVFPPEPYFTAFVSQLPSLPWFGKWVLEYEISTCFRVELCFLQFPFCFGLDWGPGFLQCTTVEAMWGLYNNSSAGLFRRGKFSVSKQLHEQATFLNTNEGFPYAKEAASYLISCKDLVFWQYSSSAASRPQGTCHLQWTRAFVFMQWIQGMLCISVSLYSCVLSHNLNSSLQIWRMSFHSGGLPWYVLVL